MAKGWVQTVEGANGEGRMTKVVLGIVDPETGHFYPFIGGGDFIGDVVGDVFGLGDEKADAMESQRGLMQQAKGDAREQGQWAAGQTEAEQQQMQELIFPLIQHLVANGLSDDVAQRLAVSLQNARGDDLSAAFQQLASFADSIEKGYFNPKDVNDIGSLLGSELQRQYEQGQQLDLTSTINFVRDQAIEQLPNVQASIGRMQEAGDRLDQAGRALGKFDQRLFDERYAPALDRLNADYELRDKQLEADLAARGISDRGSMASDPTVARSTPAEVSRSLVAREYAREAGNIAMEAQADAERQQVAEHQALQGEYATRQGEPGVITQPFDALTSIAGRAGDVGLAVHSARRQDVGQGVDALMQSAQTKGEARATPYRERQTDVTNTGALRTQSYGGALEQLSVPQTSRFGYKTGVANQTTGASAQIGSQAIQSATQQKIAGQDRLFKLGQSAALSLL